MNINSCTGLIESDLFLSYPQISHGFTTATHGDMNLSEHTQQKVLDLLSISTNQLLFSEQIHGKTIKNIQADIQISAFHRMGNAVVIPECDGFVMSKQHLSRGFALGARGADCCMILLSDPHKQIISAIHAGWKGTIEEIIARGIHHMELLGAKKTNIIMAIGPYIHPCCYSVLEKRAEMFQKRFSRYPTIVKYSTHQWYIDIGEANKTIALEQGIMEKHIDVSSFCTYCNGQFFSWRRDSVRPIQEQAGIISMIE